MPATSISTISGWPLSISHPNGTGVRAEPRGRPALTNPKTLPIWPGGAASFNNTSRGVREAPRARPEIKVKGMMARPGRSTQSIIIIMAAETITSPVTNGRIWSL